MERLLRELARARGVEGGCPMKPDALVAENVAKFDE